jgi:hypothetical protein
MSAPLRSDAFPQLARWLGRKPSPTADLYLGFACADLIRDGLITRHGPTVFSAGDTLIIMRQDGGISPLPRHNRLIYLIDDDWRAGLDDDSLPRWYRHRLNLLEARAARRFESAADLVIASSPHLAAILGQNLQGKRIEMLDPAWPEATAPLPDPTRPARTIAYLGAATHNGDADWLQRMLTPLLMRYDHLKLVWSANHPLTLPAKAAAQVEQVPALGWERYRRWMARQNFDIGLYRISGSGFSAARSLNKLLEYDQFGAAVLGSYRWDAARSAAAEGACLLAGDDIAEWRDVLTRLIREPGLAYRIALMNRARQMRDGLAAQRRRWAALLPDLAVHLHAELPIGETLRESA